MLAFKQTNPSDESLLTIRKEAESIINNHPLNHNSGEADEFFALTPSILLYGSAGNPSPVDIVSMLDELINDWRYTQAAAEQI